MIKQEIRRNIWSLLLITIRNPIPKRSFRFATLLLTLSLLFTAFVPMQTAAAAGTTVYITRTGAKYHLSGCQYLRKSKISISLENAVNQGYTACSRCNPPVWNASSASAPASKPSSQTYVTVPDASKSSSQPSVTTPDVSSQTIGQTQIQLPSNSSLAVTAYADPNGIYNRLISVQLVFTNNSDAPLGITQNGTALDANGNALLPLPLNTGVYQAVAPHSMLTITFFFLATAADDLSSLRVIYPYADYTEQYWTDYAAFLAGQISSADFSGKYPTTPLEFTLTQ